MLIRALVWTALSTTLAFGQLSNASLNGNYYFRHVLLVTNGGSGISDTRTSAGTITFNGSGGFTYTGQQLIGSAPPAALSGSGTYTVKSGGFLTLTNPQRAGATINARLGTGAIVGASTEAGATVFDFFIAIPAPSSTLSNSTLTCPYYVSSLEYPGNISNVRNTRQSRSRQCLARQATSPRITA